MLKKVQKMVCSVLLLTCTSTFADTIQAVARLKLAVGFYRSQTLDLPLIISSNDNGQSWDTITNIPFVPQHSNHLESISCVEDKCVAVGHHMYGYGTDYPIPFLLTSNDHGLSWTLVQSIQALPQIAHSALRSVNCNGDTCVASGEYNTDGNANQPFLLISHDLGGSWKFIDHFKDMTPIHGAEISNVVCDGDDCVVIMRVPFRGATYGLKANPIVSHDKGDSWQYVHHIHNLPVRDRYSLYSVQCRKGICIAGGGIAKDDKQKPMLIISRDHGKNWSYVEKIDNLPDTHHAHIHSISYSGNTWVAAGQYKTGYFNTYPLLLISDDDGEHWKTVSEITNLPKSLNHFHIADIKCENDICIAGGYARFKGRDGFSGPINPLLLVSGDRGQTYHFVTEIGNLQSQDVSIDQIHCKDDTCTAIGAYFDKKEYFPFIANSNNKGQQWSVSKIRNLPDMRDGSLNTITD